MDKEILERAIKGNDMCREKYNCSECPYHGLHYCHSILCRESRDLLKEQQEQIDKLIEESASNAEMAEGLKELLKEQQPKKGKWQPYKYGDDTWHQCSACGVADRYIDIVKRDGYPDYRMVSKRNFCPNCGAKMEGR